jgi:hypothetical protein
MPSRRVGRPIGLARRLRLRQPCVLARRTNHWCWGPLHRQFAAGPSLTTHHPERPRRQPRLRRSGRRPGRSACDAVVSSWVAASSQSLPRRARCDRLQRRFCRRDVARTVSALALLIGRRAPSLRRAMSCAHSTTPIVDRVEPAQSPPREELHSARAVGVFLATFDMPSVEQRRTVRRPVGLERRRFTRLIQTTQHTWSE